MKEDQVSSTALTVIQGLLYTAKHPEYQHLVSEETIKAAQAILSSSALGKKRLQQLESFWFLHLVPIFEWLLMPGITLHYVLRKRFIEDVTLEALNKDIVQVINLGAGFDTLAWRLHTRFPTVQFIEIDYPATIQLKAKALLQAESTTDNLHWLSVDFKQQLLREALQSFDAFDSRRKTLFICEGVLMYLQQVDIIQLLSDIRNLTGSGTQCIFTCTEAINSSKSNIRFLLDWYLKYKGEPLQWTIEAELLSDFLHRHYYELQQNADSEIFKNTYLKTHSNLRLHQGEYVVVANVL